MTLGSANGAPVLVKHHPGMMTIILNRPRVLNTMTLEMFRLVRQALETALEAGGVQFVLLAGAGERSFCAGGDLKALAADITGGRIGLADRLFREEYDLDLMIFGFPKPVIVLADGITMGAGMGLAAGADLVVASERTRMAMPETRIGFFPDVGATGWLFRKCPSGYPEFLGLTGYEVAGAECVRLGLATHLTRADRLRELQTALENFSGRLPGSRSEAARELEGLLAPFFDKQIPTNPEMDAWVAQHFAGKATLQDILSSLSRCSLDHPLCRGVHERLSERSPTALVLTLKLLRLNEGRPLAQVYDNEAWAGRWMIRHPDFLEGIRARLIDKDDRPRWQPARIEEVDLEMVLGGEPGP